jgi:hypothetical protein
MLSIHEDRMLPGIARFRHSPNFQFVALAFGAIAVLTLAACGTGNSSCSGGYSAGDIGQPGLLDCSSSSGSSSGSTSGPVDPNSPSALSNALSITSSNGTTTGTMTKFLYPLNYVAYATGTTGSVDLHLPATATAQSGMTTTLVSTSNPSVAGLVPFCDVEPGAPSSSPSYYSYWVSNATQGETLTTAPLTIVITWPTFTTTSGTINFRCTGVLNDSIPTASNSAIETTTITVIP